MKAVSVSLQPINRDITSQVPTSSKKAKSTKRGTFSKKKGDNGFIRVAVSLFPSTSGWCFSTF